MATARTLHGAFELERRGLPVRRLLAGAAAWWTAIREGSAAARDYERLVCQGVPHERAAARVFDEHFRH